MLTIEVCVALLIVTASASCPALYAGHSRMAININFTGFFIVLSNWNSSKVNKNEVNRAPDLYPSII